MRILKAGAVYWLLVFGAGFALAFLRVPVLVPRLGVRAAELVELAIMLPVILWASRRLARSLPGASRGARLAAGLVALALLAVSETALAWLLGVRTFDDYLAGRDPVSGFAYLVSLTIFALAPAAWSARSAGRVRQEGAGFGLASGPDRVAGGASAARRVFAGNAVPACCAGTRGSHPDPHPADDQGRECDVSSRRDGRGVHHAGSDHRGREDDHRRSPASDGPARNPSPAGGSRRDGGRGDQ